MRKITKTILKNIYKARSSQAKKYDFGLLLVIGGSEFYTGSPALSAMAGFRAGVDMVRIIAPRRAADIIASFSPNLSTSPLHGERLCQEHLSNLVSQTKAAQEVANGKAAVVIGGGLGRSSETKEAVAQYLSQIDIPAVIDADAIHAVAGKPELLRGKKFLLTPHAYEFFILTGKQVQGCKDKARMELVKTEASRLKTTILLKGKTDLISDGKTIAQNSTGNPCLTVGGTGDTLAGIAAAFLARGLSCFEAASAAAYINGKAGEMAAKRLGEGMLATDLIEAIPEVISKL